MNSYFFSRYFRPGDGRCSWTVVNPDGDTVAVFYDRGTFDFFCACVVAQGGSMTNQQGG